MKLSNGLLCAVFLLGTVFSVQATPAASYVQAKTQQSLIDHIIALEGLNDGTGDPAKTQACFTEYLPILSEVQSTFQTQYQACVSLATQQMSILTSEAAANKSEYIQETNELCTGFTTCQSATDVLDFFNCYADVANNNVSMIYQLGANATLAASTLVQDIKTIQTDEAQCTNTTENTYVKNTAAVYAELDACLGIGLQASTVATYVKPNSLYFSLGGMGLIPSGLTDGSNPPSNAGIPGMGLIPSGLTGGSNQPQVPGMGLIPSGLTGGQSSSGQGQPSDGQSSSGQGQSSSGENQTSSGQGQSATGQASDGKNQTSSGQSQPWTGQPTSGKNSTTSSEQGQSATGQSSDGKNQTSSGQSQPTTGQATSGKNQTSSGQKPPASGQSPSGSGQSQPSGGQSGSQSQSSNEGIPIMYLPPEITNNGLPTSNQKPIAPMTPNQFLP